MGTFFKVLIIIVILIVVAAVARVILMVIDKRNGLSVLWPAADGPASAEAPVATGPMDGIWVPGPVVPAPA